MSSRDGTITKRFLEASTAIADLIRVEERIVQEDQAKLEKDVAAHLPHNASPNDLKLPDPKASDVIKLNVGGDSTFTTRRDTLTSVPGSRLALLFGGRWDMVLPRDPNGRIFLDLDPLQFRALLGWLVDVKRVGPGAPLPPYPTECLPRERRWGFEALCRHLGLRESGDAAQEGRLFRGHGVLPIAAPLSMEEDAQGVDARVGTYAQPEINDIDTFIMKAESLEKFGLLFADVSSLAPGDLSFKLLYRASRDGFAMTVFHQQCDHKGPTVVIARSIGGYVFGGFTETSWDSTGQYKPSPEAFLFRLEGPSGSPIGIPVSKHTICQNHGNAIYCHTSHAATFGGAHDMRIFPEGPATKATFAVGNTYNSVGTGGANTYLAESANVVITDWEVFAVQKVPDLHSASCHLQAEAKFLLKSLPARNHDFFKQATTLSNLALNCKHALKQYRSQIEMSRQGLEDEVEFMRHFLGTRVPNEHGTNIFMLNIGGNMMGTFRSTLTQSAGSTLAAKFGLTWTLQDEELVDGAVFIDEDPTLFGIVLQYLRFSKLLSTQVDMGDFYVPEGKRAAFKRLLMYLNMERDIMLKHVDSNVIQEEEEAFLGMIAAVSSKPPQLLYRASRDGFTAFHQKCDLKGPTVVLARSSGGHVFGGFTKTPWDGTGQYRPSPDAFLFRLEGPSGISMSKHTICQNHGNAIYCHSGHAAIFGGGPDMHIFADGIAAKAAFAIGNTYNSAGSGGTNTYLAESANVVVTDWEVFGV